MLANGEKLYTLTYSVKPLDDKSTSSMSVVLDPQLPAKITVNPSPLPENPSILAATFDNVPEGVHTLSLLADDKPISKEIVAISGPNRDISFGVSPKPTTAYQSYILAIIIIIVILTSLALGYVFYWRKKHILM
jgi:hypothetical protein